MSELTRRIELLAQGLRDLKSRADKTPLRIEPAILDIVIKIFKVQSEAAGDGVYICFVQKLLSAEWDGVAGNPKLSDKNETPVEVLNLHEYAPEAGQHNLPTGTLLEAWQMTDDEGTLRWVGKVIIPWPVCEE